MEYRGQEFFQICTLKKLTVLGLWVSNQHANWPTLTIDIDTNSPAYWSKDLTTVDEMQPMYFKSQGIEVSSRDRNGKGGR